MKTVFLMRHGDYDPLFDDFTESGKKALEHTIKKLSQEDIRFIVYSPIRRAHLTAQVVNRHFDVEMQSDERLSVTACVDDLRAVLKEVPSGTLIVTHEVLIGPYLGLAEEVFRKAQVKKIVLAEHA